MIVLSRNECPYPPSPLVREYIAKFLDRINRYEIPSLMDSIIDSLSSYVGVDRRYIYLLPGSEALFTSIPWMMIRYGYRFIYSSPTFTPAIDDLRVWDIEIIDVPLTSDFRVDLNNVLRYSGDSILYIVNPNNPTGNKTIECSEVEDLATSFKAIVIDEAYYEYSGLTCKDLVLEYDNIAILRTLSKAFCLAGARLGYIICNPRLYKEFFGARRRYDISTLSLLAGLGALSDLDYMRKVVKNTLKVKKWVVSELEKLEDIEVIDTLTNFILVSKKNYDSHRLAKALKDKGVLVKELNDRMKQYIRVSIGTLDEMKFFVKVLKEI
ncbi:MAG: hypothetical protein B6U89_07550 [Desulfurococcales archaeon ex4484_58]|nr:MAG: hypothetical protein B6U89_07550 [Desulfurococcales archaeon ex4484_58]